MKVLVTGGGGYLGSLTCRALEVAGHLPVVLDSLVTGQRAFVRDRTFYEGDIADRALLGRIADDHPDLGTVIHMAARVVVPESVADPLLYYRENVAKSLELLDELAARGVTRVIFSSSASVYAPSPSFAVDESSPVAPTSPYARTKHMVEQVLADLADASPLRAVILRYFNPIGSDPDLQSGVHAREPSHVLGQLVLTAQGRRPAFAITGTDLPTRDGTGVRDYLHGWDLVRAHVRAVERFDHVLAGGDTSAVLNLGTGRGVTVRELVAAFERVYGRPVPVTEAPPRPGDAVGAYAIVDKAAHLLGWRAELTLDDAIRSSLQWAGRRHTVLGYT